MGEETVAILTCGVSRLGEGGDLFRTPSRVVRAGWKRDCPPSYADRGGKKQRKVPLCNPGWGLPLCSHGGVFVREACCPMALASFPLGFFISGTFRFNLLQEVQPGEATAPEPQDPALHPVPLPSQVTILLSGWTQVLALPLSILGLVAQKHL